MNVLSGIIEKLKKYIYCIGQKAYMNTVYMSNTGKLLNKRNEEFN